MQIASFIYIEDSEEDLVTVDNLFQKTNKGISETIR
jgi:hypothetical protein